MIVPLMALGGLGVISVAANIIPREMHLMTAAYLSGNVGLAKEIQLKCLEFINALFIETNPIPIKEAMNLMGMEVGKYRLPLYEMESGAREYLRETMRALFAEERMRKAV